MKNIAKLKRDYIKHIVPILKKHYDEDKDLSGYIGFTIFPDDISLMVVFTKHEIELKEYEGYIKISSYDTFKDLSKKIPIFTRGNILYYDEGDYETMNRLVLKHYREGKNSSGKYTGSFKKLRKLGEDILNTINKKRYERGYKNE